MNNPKVSVVVPVYNVEKYLERCVLSIVNQTYKNIEIILVDDGSPDSCPAMCDSFAAHDERIIAVHKQNAGLGMARNTGMEHASGDYIMFVDSDDYIDITAVEKCVAEILKTDADIVMFGRNNVSADGNIIKKEITAVKTVFEKEELGDLLSGLFTYKLGIGISAWGKLYNMDVFRKGGIEFFSEREVLAEDAMFMLLFFAHAKKATVLAENMYYYIQNDASLSRAYKKGYQSRADVFVQRGRELCRTLGLPKTVGNGLCARYLMFSISGMKKILGSSLSKKEKKAELKTIFSDSILLDSINKDVLNLCNSASKVFWQLFKLKMYHLCVLMLWSKIKK
ncbi:MAG: glycosyltransferase family 2 protein [Ruminococcaceae bacterium]|nr:glycosyltransferase family 2 protein [Oscillospiraceae bacterium]